MQTTFVMLLSEPEGLTLKQKTNYTMRLLISVLLLFSVFSGIYAQETAYEKLEKALAKSVPEFPKSKVFLKTDKDIYAAGEKIWFKAEVFNCLTESASSESSLIVLIKAESGEVIVDNKFVMTSGLVASQITIPSWAPEGNAFLIAYTPNALKVNEATLAAVKPITINTLKHNDYILTTTLNKVIAKPGEEVRLTVNLDAVTPSAKKEKLIISLYDYQNEIFSQKVTVMVNEENEFKYKLPDKVAEGLYFVIESTGKNKFSQKKPVYTTNDRITVEFFPEGGSLLTNNIQRIVYRATDPFGDPTDVTGSVYDPLGNQVGAGKILKPGIGLISLMPMPNQKYTFELDSQYGNGQKFEMPSAILDGTIFTLVKTEDELIKAAIVNTGNNVGKELTVVAIANGQAKLAFTLDAKEKNSLHIKTAELPQGIINFVVLDSKGEVLSERMIYNTPYEDINIDIQTVLKPTLKNGEVEIQVDASNFVSQFGPAMIDVKVVDLQNLYHNTNQDYSYSFLKYPLLTSTPKTVLDIYITNIELIANNYRYFEIKDIIDGVNYITQDGKGKSFSGTVTDKDGCRIPNATVMALHPDNPSIASTTTDENGRFVLTGTVKSNDLVIKAISDSGKKTYEVYLDRTFDETLEELLLFESFNVRPLYSAEETPPYFLANENLLRLSGSETKEKRPKELSNSQKMLQSGSSILDVVRMIKPFTLKGSEIVFYGTTNSILNQQGALIVIDGQKMGTSISAFDNINSYDVESINVSTNPVDIQQYTALNSVGIIDIKTRGSAPSMMEKKEELEIYVSEFDQTLIPEDIWKYQTTLFWQPNMLLDKSGKLNLNLKLSEIQSKFVVQVDIIGANGATHRQETEFSTVRENKD